MKIYTKIQIVVWSGVLAIVVAMFAAHVVLGFIGLGTALLLQALCMWADRPELNQ